MRSVLLLVSLVLVVGACGDGTVTTSAEPAAACAPDGSVDLDPAEEPWRNAAGCEVGADIISLRAGPAQCGWELVEFLTIGDPLGSSISTGGLTYLWDPVNLLAYVDGDVRNRSFAVGDQPASVADTGFRRDDDQLWADPDDPAHLYVVRRTRVDRFELDRHGTISCP